MNTPFNWSVSLSSGSLSCSFSLGWEISGVSAMFAGSLLQQWNHQWRGHAQSNGLSPRFPLLTGPGSRTPALSCILPNRLLLPRWKCCKYHFKAQKHYEHRWSLCQMINGTKHSNYFLFYYLCPTQDPNPVPCPKGTYSRQPGLRDPSDCKKCPEGKYCYTENPKEEPIIEPVWLPCSFCFNCLVII